MHDPEPVAVAERFGRCGRRAPWLRLDRATIALSGHCKTGQRGSLLAKSKKKRKTLQLSNAAKRAARPVHRRSQDRKRWEIAKKATQVRGRRMSVLPELDDLSTRSAIPLRTSSTSL